MSEFEHARKKYRPETAQYTLVAEAPPSHGTGRFFYFENVPTGDSLFLEIMKALYPDARGNVEQVRATKVSFLKRFRDDGFYLIDACHDPTPSQSRAVKLKCLRAGLEQLQRDLSEIGHPAMKVVLISATVYKVCCAPLRRAGWNVINTEMIDFPGWGRQKKFQKKFRSVLERDGWQFAG